MLDPTEPALRPDPRQPDLARDLASLLNRYSAENGSNTPDFLLAEHLLGCLDLFNRTIAARAKWYGRMDAPGQPAVPPEAEALWKLLDDIDTADDRLKPLDPTSGPDALARFREFVMEVVAKRSEILSSDGYKLTPAERFGERFSDSPGHPAADPSPGEPPLEKRFMSAVVRDIKGKVAAAGDNLMSGNATEAKKYIADALAMLDDLRP